jgi:hypothetical protein
MTAGLPSANMLAVAYRIAQFSRQTQWRDTSPSLTRFRNAVSGGYGSGRCVFLIQTSSACSSSVLKM